MFRSKCACDLKYVTCAPMCVCVCVDGCGVFIFVYSVHLYSRALPIPSVLFWSGNSSVSTSLLPPTSCYWLLRILSPHTSLSIVSLFLLLPHIPLHCRMSHYCTRYEHLTRNPFLLVYKVNLCCRFKSVQIETIALLWGEAQLCLPYVCLKKDK